MAIDDVYVLTVIANTSAGINQNSLAFVRTVAADPTAAEMQTLGNAIKDIHRAQQGNIIQYQSYRGRQVRGGSVVWPSGTSCTPTGGLLFEGPLSGTLGGALTGDGLPPQCALVTTLRTAQIGRRRRGRFYAGGQVEASQVTGAWTTSHMTATDASWTTFLGTYAVTLPASGFRLGIWSFRTASGCVPNTTGRGHVRVDPPNPAGAFEPVTTHLVRNTVFTQRRRVLGVGR